MEEGELLRMKAQAAIQEEENKEKARRDKAYKLNEDIKDINVQNREIKNKQLQKEREEEERIEEYRKNKGKVSII